MKDLTATPLQDEIDFLMGEIQDIERQFSDSKVKLKNLQMDRLKGVNTDREYLELMDWRRRANYKKQSLLKELRDLKDERKGENISQQSARVLAQKELHLQAKLMLIAFDAQFTAKQKKDVLEGLRAAIAGYEAHAINGERSDPTSPNPHPLNPLEGK
jgi:hypothetical protein